MWHVHDVTCPHSDLSMIWHVLPSQLCAPDLFTRGIQMRISWTKDVGVHWFISKSLSELLAFTSPPNPPPPRLPSCIRGSVSLKLSDTSTLPVCFSSDVTGSLVISGGGPVFLSLRPLLSASAVLFLTLICFINSCTCASLWCHFSDNSLFPRALGEIHTHSDRHTHTHTFIITRTAKGYLSFCVK